MVVTVDDAHLVAAARSGDVPAFELLVARHQKRVFRVALRMLGDAAEAEDAAQDTFVAAWRALGRYRGEGAFSTWLYRIAVNKCLDRLAARRVTEPLDDRVASAIGGPEEIAQGHARFAALIRALAALSGEQRAALVLRELEGLSYEEVAAVLGVTVAAVKGRLHRARAELVSQMRDWR